MIDYANTVWGDLLKRMDRFEKLLSDHAEEDRQFQAKMAQTHRKQGVVRFIYFAVTLAALYSNGMHAPEWLFKLMNGFLQ